MEQQHLYDQFHFDEAWDSPHNKSLIPQMPVYYEHPAVQEDLPVGYTVYQMATSQPSDPSPAIHTQGTSGVNFSAITDGTSNTIMMLEVDAQAAVPWTKPADWKFDPNDPRRDFGTAFHGGRIV